MVPCCLILNEPKDLGMFLSHLSMRKPSCVCEEFSEILPSHLHWVWICQGLWICLKFHCQSFSFCCQNLITRDKDHLDLILLCVWWMPSSMSPCFPWGFLLFAQLTCLFHADVKVGLVQSHTHKSTYPSNCPVLMWTELGVVFTKFSAIWSSCTFTLSMWYCCLLVTWTFAIICAFWIFRSAFPNLHLMVVPCQAQDKFLHMTVLFVNNSWSKPLQCSQCT